MMQKNLLHIFAAANSETSQIMSFCDIMKEYVRYYHLVKVSSENVNYNQRYVNFEIPSKIE